MCEYACQLGLVIPTEMRSCLSGPFPASRSRKESRFFLRVAEDVGGPQVFRDASLAGGTFRLPLPLLELQGQMRSGSDSTMRTRAARATCQLLTQTGTSGRASECGSELAHSLLL